MVAAGGSSSVGTANPVGSDGPVVTGSPIGPCETLSPFFQSALEPLEHSVPEVILERSSRKKFSALEHSVPDEVLERSSRRKLSALDPLEHSGLDQAGPVGPVGLFGTGTIYILWNVTLVHHYRVHKRGLPHITFHRNYLSQLRALLPSPVTLPPAWVVSLESSGSGSLCLVGSPEGVFGPARTMIRAHRRRRPVRVEEPAVVNVPVLTLQDPLAAVVLDCRPPLLPVSMDISGVDLSAIQLRVVYLNIFTWRRLQKAQ